MKDENSYLPNCQTNLVISCTVSIDLGFDKHNLGRYEPSSPATKELHDYSNLLRLWAIPILRTIRPPTAEPVSKGIKLIKNWADMSLHLHEELSFLSFLLSFFLCEIGRIVS